MEESKHHEPTKPEAFEPSPEIDDREAVDFVLKHLRESCVEPTTGKDIFEVWLGVAKKLSENRGEQWTDMRQKERLESIIGIIDGIKFAVPVERSEGEIKAAIMLALNNPDL